MGAEQPVGVVLYPLGARLAARFLGWLGTRLTDHIDKVSMSGDALVRSEASKHRHAVAQVPTWIAIVLVYRVTVVLIIDRLGIQPKPVTGRFRRWTSPVRRVWSTPAAMFSGRTVGTHARWGRRLGSGPGALWASPGGALLSCSL